MFELKPMNKYLVIDPLKEDERVGSEGIIIAPGNALAKQHRMARIVAKDASDEAKDLRVGDIVFYDHIGAVEGRVGQQGFTMVKAINVLAVVRRSPAANFQEILEAIGTDPVLPDPPLPSLFDDTRERLVELATKPLDVAFPRAEAVGRIEVKAPDGGP